MHDLSLTDTLLRCEQNTLAWTYAVSHIVKRRYPIRNALNRSLEQDILEYAKLTLDMLREKLLGVIPEVQKSCLISGSDEVVGVFSFSAGELNLVKLRIIEELCD